MKPLFISLALLCAPACAFSQGVVAFRNDNLSSPPQRLVQCLDGPLVGTTFAAQLRYGADPSSLTPHPTLAYFRAPTTSSPGTWSGGGRTLAGAGGVGITIFLEVVVWDSGASRTITFDEARASGAVWGRSQIFSYTQVLSSPPNPTEDTKMQNFMGFTILTTCVPEPAVSLLLLPAAAVVWFLNRRKKQ